MLEKNIDNKFAEFEQISIFAKQKEARKHFLPQIRNHVRLKKNEIHEEWKEIFFLCALYFLLPANNVIMMQKR